MRAACRAGSRGCRARRRAGRSSPAQASSARPPPNRRANSSPKCSFSSLEGGGQPLAPLLIERRDAAAQLRDRGGQIGALVFEPAEPGLDLGHLLRRQQVDRPDRRRARAAAGRAGRRDRPRSPSSRPPPVAADERARVRPGRCRDARRFRRAAVPSAVLGGLAARLQPGPPFARRGDRRLGAARRLGRLAQHRLGRRQRLFGRLSLGGGRGGARGQRLALARRSPADGRPKLAISAATASCRSASAACCAAASSRRLRQDSASPAIAASRRRRASAARASRSSAARASASRRRASPASDRAVSSAARAAARVRQQCQRALGFGDLRREFGEIGPDLVDRLDRRRRASPRPPGRGAPARLRPGAPAPIVPRRPATARRRRARRQRRSRARRGSARPARRPARACVLAAAISPASWSSRLRWRSCSAAALAPAPIRTKPSQRHNLPSRSTRLCPGPRSGCNRQPSAAFSTQPACARRRASAAGAATHPRADARPSGSGAGSSAASATQPRCLSRLPGSGSSGAASSPSNSAATAASNPAVHAQLRQQRRPLRAEIGLPGVRIRLSAFASASSGASTRSASRARSSAAASRCCAAASISAASAAAARALLRVGGGLRHGRARGGGGFRRDDRGEQRFALPFAVGEPRTQAVRGARADRGAAGRARRGAPRRRRRPRSPAAAGFRRWRDRGQPPRPAPPPHGVRSRPRRRRVRERRAPRRAAPARPRHRRGARPRGRGRRRSAPDAARPRRAPPRPLASS